MALFSSEYYYQVDSHGPVDMWIVNTIWMISWFWLALNPFCPLNAPLMYSAAVWPTPYSWMLNMVTMSTIITIIKISEYVQHHLSTLHMLKFVTSILNSWDSGKGNSLTACNTKYLLLDIFSNPSKAGLNSKSQKSNLEVRNLMCRKIPVWGSSLGRLGTRQVLSQSAATWSNDPKKVTLQAAPIDLEGETI